MSMSLRLPALSRSLLKYLHWSELLLVHSQCVASRPISFLRVAKVISSPSHQSLLPTSCQRQRQRQMQRHSSIIPGSTLTPPGPSNFILPLTSLRMYSAAPLGTRKKLDHLADKQRPQKTQQSQPQLRQEQEQEQQCALPHATAQTWQERLWGPGAKKGAKPLKPDDLPEHDEAEHISMFNTRRTLTAKAALESRLRCTEVDENGEVILVDGEFKKGELIAKYGLLPRDLRKIDSSNLPHILVRPSAILLNLLHLKVLIKHDRVLLFDVYGSKTSYPQSAFMYDLQGKLQQKHIPGSGSLPYEFRALEAVLLSVTYELEADFETVREPVIRILSELEDDIDRHKLRVLLILSKRVTTFEQKAKLVRDAIEELLEADDDLAAMYLTEKAHDLVRGQEDHTEVEMLLESYHKLCDEIVQESGNLVNSIRNTEEIVRAILDANRNSLMLLDLKFSVGTLGLAMGTFLAGLYGMNLENFIEETKWGFSTVTGVSVAFSLLVCFYGLTKLRKVQRVKMYGDMEQRVQRSQHWFQDDGPVALLEARNREKLRRVHQQKAIIEKQKKWWKIPGPK